MSRPSGALLLGALFALPAFAHKGSDAYWTLRLDSPSTSVSGRFDIALKDLDAVVPLDVNHDGEVRWGEIASLQSSIEAQLRSSLSLTQQAMPCPLVFDAPQVVRHSDGLYLAVPLSARCPASVTELEAGYGLLFDVDAQHRGLLSVSGASGGNWVSLTSNARTRKVSFSATPVTAQASHALGQGIHHISIGWDHLCFLFALLLPSVLRRDGGRWTSREQLKPTLLDVTKVVTAFTLAHSLTLGLAAFGVVHPNGQWVEVAIAASVALAAFNNLVPFVPETRWSLAFSLGLLHGFGFVSAIQDLGAEASALWLSVLGFNLGVELGQLAIVAVVVPLLWLLRRSSLYPRVLLPLGSAVILGIALFWTAERLGLA